MTWAGRIMEHKNTTVGGRQRDHASIESARKNVRLAADCFSFPSFFAAQSDVVRSACLIDRRLWGFPRHPSHRQLANSKYAIILVREAPACSAPGGRFSVRDFIQHRSR
jgi:hypothetical protein